MGQSWELLDSTGGGEGGGPRENWALDSVFERGTREGQQTPALGLGGERRTLRAPEVVRDKADNWDALMN